MYINCLVFYFQYIELFKVKSESVSLDNYGIIICDVRGENFLNIRLAIDLSGSTIGNDQHFGLVTNANQFESIIPKWPSHGHWRIFGKHGPQNWLEVGDQNMIAVFLVFTEGNKLFDIYEKTIKQNWFPLKDSKLAFLQVYQSTILHGVIEKIFLFYTVNDPFGEK